MPHRLLLPLLALVACSDPSASTPEPASGQEPGPETMTARGGSESSESYESYESNGPNEPSETRESPRAITFADLSLVGSDVDGLLDAMFDEQGEAEFEYPESVADLDRNLVEIIGYMIALEYEDDGQVSEFMLVRDLAACCFGGMPRPDEWVHVKMAEGTGSNLFLMVPFSVTGRLAVGLQREEGGFLSSAFQLEGTATRAR